MSPCRYLFNSATISLNTRCVSADVTAVFGNKTDVQRSVTHDSLRYINILTYLLTYLLTHVHIQVSCHRKIIINWSLPLFISLTL